MAHPQGSLLGKLRSQCDYQGGKIPTYRLEKPRGVQRQSGEAESMRDITDGDGCRISAT